MMKGTGMRAEGRRRRRNTSALCPHPSDLVSRRQFLRFTAAATGITFMQNAFGQWQPSQRYPDPLVRAIDPSFNKYKIGLAKVEKLADGCRWCEGPVWFGDGRYLLWSDIPNNRIMKWEEETG